MAGERELQHGTGFVYENRLLHPTIIPTELPEDEVQWFLQKSFSSLISTRNKLNEGARTIKAHGVRRSSRESTEVAKLQASQLRKVTGALEVFTGHAHKAIEIITSINKETGKLEPIGFRLVDTNGNTRKS